MDSVVGLLLPTCALAGAAVLSGFFFPGFVGEAVSGRAWLVVSLVFFISGLGYLAALPEAAEPTEPYLFRVRRTGALTAARGFVAAHDPWVLGPALVGVVAFVAGRGLAPGATTAAVDAVSRVVLRELGALFLVTVFLGVCYCLFLVLGPWGDVRLGDPDAEPSYTYPTYVTLVFTAGIAAGVVFWGPAEALVHFQSPTPYFGGEPGSDAAAAGALTYALFHWGFSA